MYTVPKLHSKNEELFISLVTLPWDFVSLKELGEDVPLAPRTHVQVSASCWVSAPSVYFHCGVDLPDKHVGCIEANGASEEPEGQDHEGGVAEV